MTLICKPAGRGNWLALKMVVTGTRAQPFAVAVGDTFELGGVTWRVCAIEA